MGSFLQKNGSKPSTIPLKIEPKKTKNAQERVSLSDKNILNPFQINNNIVISCESDNSELRLCQQFCRFMEIYSAKRYV